MKLKEFFFFRRMLIPYLVQIVFWLGAVICFFVGLYGVFNDDVWMGLIVLILGPVFLRLICEYIVVLFRINDTLTDIRDMMVKKM